MADSLFDLFFVFGCIGVQLFAVLAACIAYQRRRSGESTTGGADVP